MWCGVKREPVVDEETRAYLAALAAEEPPLSQHQKDVIPQRHSVLSLSSLVIPRDDEAPRRQVSYQGVRTPPGIQLIVPPYGDSVAMNVIRRTFLQVLPDDRDRVGAEPAAILRWSVT